LQTVKYAVKFELNLILSYLVRLDFNDSWLLLLPLGGGGGGVVWNPRQDSWNSYLFRFQRGRGNNAETTVNRFSKDSQKESQKILRRFSRDSQGILKGFSDFLSGFGWGFLVGFLRGFLKIEKQNDQLWNRKRKCRSIDQQLGNQRYQNRIKLNRITLNRITLNGIKWNQMESNGIKWNQMDANESELDCRMQPGVGVKGGKNRHHVLMQINPGACDGELPLCKWAPHPLAPCHLENDNSKCSHLIQTVATPHRFSNGNYGNYGNYGKHLRNDVIVVEDTHGRGRWEAGGKGPGWRRSRPGPGLQFITKSQHSNYKIQSQNYKIQFKNYKIQITKFNLKITKFNLRITKFNLKITKLNLKFTKFKLKITKFNLKITKLNLKFTKFKLKITKFKLQN